jgi:tetratricopeptide (TPR) repeat protein
MSCKTVARSFSSVPSVLWCLYSLQAAPADRCAPCHPKEVKGFAGTGMGNSLASQATQPAGRFIHSESGTKFSVRSAEGGMRQRISRDGLSGEYPVAYAVGSGHRAFGYLVQIGDYLFQSPIAYYTQPGAWDIAPGFEKFRLPDFNRAATFECVLCHSGTPRYVRGTKNRFERPPFTDEAITCERCHGPTERHVAAPSRSNIVNPARLPPDARDSVCEQCHLTGEVRVLNPGRELDDYTPGEPLEKVLTVYIGDSDEDHPLKVIHQSEQLRRSTCWKQSGSRMWCASCHDPHQEPTDKAAHYRERCLVCHGATLASSHGAPTRDCISCHLQSRATVDGAHTAFTDHQIRIRPKDDATPQKPAGLVAWRPPPPEYATRNLGLAYLGVGERERSAEALGKALPLLIEAQKAYPRDPEVTAGLGLLLYLKGLYREAAAAFELAARLRPGDVRFYQDAAYAWKTAGDSKRAITNLETAIQIDPSAEEAYRMLARIYREQGSEAMSDRILDRYLSFRPQSIEFRQRSHVDSGLSGNPAAPYGKPR